MVERLSVSKEACCVDAHFRSPETTERSEGDVSMRTVTETFTDDFTKLGITWETHV